MTFDWKCIACGASGSVENPGLPVTSLVNKAALDHREKRPECPIAASAEVTLLPGACIFHGAL